MAPPRKKMKFSDDFQNYSDFFGGLKPCPHLHFNMDIINREALSRDQHLNLLATPKGLFDLRRSLVSSSIAASKSFDLKVVRNTIKFPLVHGRNFSLYQPLVFCMSYRWEELSKKKDGEPATYTNKPRIICGGRRMKKEEKTYIQNYLAELWTLFTPDLENRLKGVLMNEFGMGPKEAEDFLVKQRKINVKRSTTVGISENTWYCPGNLTPVIYEKRANARRPCQRISLGVRHYWIKEFTQNMANSMNAYIMTMLSVKRTKRTLCFSEVILEFICNILGEVFTLDSPKTKMQRFWVFVADRLGVLLGGITCAADAQLMEMLRRLEEGKEVPPPPPPPEEPEPEEPEVVEEEEGEIEEVEEELVPEEEEKVEEVVEEPEEEVEEEAEEEKPEVTTVQVEKPKEVPPAKEAPVISEPEEEEEEEEAEEEEEITEEIEEAEEIEEPPVEEEEAVEVVEEEEIVVPPKKEVSEELSELDIMKHIVSWIDVTKPEASPRQAAIDKIVKARLESRVPPKDERTRKAIDEVSDRVSTWVDKLVKEVEKEFGICGPKAEPEAFARPTFRIKKDYGAACYNVKEIPSALVLQKVKEGRSKPAKAMTGAITKRPVKAVGIRKPKGMEDWASWATDVASVAENWAGWIDQTCTKLAETADKHKKGKGMSKEEWARVKRETANKAIEWRKNKLLLKEAAKMWEKKFKKK